MCHHCRQFGLIFLHFRPISYRRIDVLNFVCISQGGKGRKNIFHWGFTSHAMPNNACRNSPLELLSRKVLPTGVHATEVVSRLFPTHGNVSFEIDPETQFVSSSLDRAHLSIVSNKFDTRDTRDTGKCVFRDRCRPRNRLRSRLDRDCISILPNLESFQLQGSTLFCAPGLVKFVPAVARLFCVPLPGSFLNVLCAE